MTATLHLSWLGHLRRAIPSDARFRGYFQLLETPVLGDAYMLARRPLRPNRVTARTELVLEGYPRSANTYGRFAFDHVNPGTRVSSHTHSALSVIRGLQRGLPCIVLLRDPRDAVPSLLQWMPGLTAASALKYYIRYYSRLMHVRSDLVVAPFELVHNNFGTIIDECNERFGSSFVPYRPTRTNEMAVRKHVELMSRRNFGGDLRETSVARPSSARLRERAPFVELVEAEQHLCRRAIDVWRDFRDVSRLGGPSAP